SCGTTSSAGRWEPWSWSTAGGSPTPSTRSTTSKPTSASPTSWRSTSSRASSTTPPSRSERRWRSVPRCRSSTSTPAAVCRAARCSRPCSDTPWSTIAQVSPSPDGWPGAPPAPVGFQESKRHMRKILIVGAGHAGLHLAHGLLSHGYDVTVITGQSSQEIRTGKPAISQWTYPTALENERALDLDFWSALSPQVREQKFFMVPEEDEPLYMVGSASAGNGYVVSVDRRVKMAD